MQINSDCSLLVGDVCRRVAELDSRRSESIFMVLSREGQEQAWRWLLCGGSRR